MGRIQQITLAAARAAHEARRAIGELTNEPAHPAYDQLAPEEQGSVIRHTSLVLAGEAPIVDTGDDVATLVAHAIQTYDEMTAEPKFEPPVPMPVHLTDDTGAVINVKELP